MPEQPSTATAEPQAAPELFAEDVSAISWEELIEELIPGDTQRSPDAHIVAECVCFVTSDAGHGCRTSP